MDIFTKDRLLTNKENSIKHSLISDDKQYRDTFNLLFNYFRLDFFRGKSNYFLVFSAIYIDNVKLPNWELANYCHVCKTTLYDYRNEIIDLFYDCLDNNLTIKDFDSPKD